MFERLNTWLYLNRIYIEMSGNDLAQRESTRDGRRGGSRGRRSGSGGGRPSFSGVPKTGTGRPRVPVARVLETAAFSREGRVLAQRRDRVPPANATLYIGGRAGRLGGPRRASAEPPGRFHIWTEAKRRDCAAAPHPDRGETPGRRLPPARNPPIPSPLYRAGVVGILCAGGFPARAAPGERIIPNSSPRRAQAPRREAPRGPRDGRRKLSEKSS